LHMSHLSASVNKADMDSSLLGMSFLKRLQSFRVEGNTLVLIP
jgi:predicted aspartyl protease